MSMVNSVFLSGISLGVDIFFYLFLVIACLFIYFETKNIYKLSSHKGLKYFRNSFLFFGIASFFKLILSFVSLNSAFYFQSVFFIVLFFNLIAGLSFIFALNWKKLDRFSWMLYTGSFLIVLFSILIRSPLIYLLTQLSFLIYGIILIFSKKNVKKEGLAFVYPFVLLFWFFSVLDIFLVNVSIFFEFSVYFISIILFVIILSRTIKSLHFKK
ncbi:MAG: hypothetical protein U9Q99_03340 [Nanoarchaeota archaeon]|nr:hypothetical protein [Nanoarchaeota archaeon]